MVVERAQDGTPLRLIGTNTDIDAMKLAALRAERHGRLYIALAACNVALARRGSTDELLARVCEILVTSGEMKLAWVGVVDSATGRTEGRQALMRIVPEHGVIEIGSIYWGPRMARSRLATEALYLAARYVFDELGYRRFEWKCNDNNTPSKRAAERFGFSFEGIFRQHMIQKGQNRDTAWFAMLDGEWPARKAEYERWLAPDNFDGNEQQRSRLRFDKIGSRT